MAYYGYEKLIQVLDLGHAVSTLPCTYTPDLVPTMFPKAHVLRQRSDPGYIQPLYETFKVEDRCHSPKDMLVSDIFGYPLYWDQVKRWMKTAKIDRVWILGQRNQQIILPKTWLDGKAKRISRTV